MTALQERTGTHLFYGLKEGGDYAIPVGLLEGVVQC